MPESEKKSYVAAFYAMFAAFAAAEREILRPGRTWHSISRLQERLLQEIFRCAGGELGLIPEIETIVSWSADQINSFLAKRGMDDIRLSPFEGSTFGFAAFMKILTRWIEEGVSMPIQGVDGVSYPGARLPSHGLNFFEARGHDAPIVSLRTRSTDVVSLTAFDADLDPFDLIHRARQLLEGKKPIYDYDGLHFPMVDLNIKPPVEWLHDMWTTLDDGARVSVTQAIQQCKLQMNHRGAIVQDAFAGALTFECMMNPDLLIDSSFLFILERQGGPNGSFFPFIGVLRPDCWKDPGELSFT